MKRQAGWTLIELIIVLVLVGILGSSYFARFGTIHETTRGTVTEKIVSDVRTALVVWEADALLKGEKNIYPEKLDDAEFGFASEMNSFFTVILHAPGVTKGWEKLEALVYRPIGEATQSYQYYPDDGRFDQ